VHLGLKIVRGNGRKGIAAGSKSAVHSRSWALQDSGSTRRVRGYTGIVHRYDFILCLSTASMSASDGEHWLGRKGEAAKSRRFAVWCALRRRHGETSVRRWGTRPSSSARRRRTTSLGGRTRNVQVGAAKKRSASASRRRAGPRPMLEVWDRAPAFREDAYRGRAAESRTSGCLRDNFDQVSHHRLRIDFRGQKCRPETGGGRIVGEQVIQSKRGDGKHPRRTWGRAEGHTAALADFKDQGGERSSSH